MPSPPPQPSSMHLSDSKDTPSTLETEEKSCAGSPVENISPAASPVAMIRRALETGSIAEPSIKSQATKNEKRSLLSPLLISPFQSVEPMGSPTQENSISGGSHKNPAVTKPSKPPPIHSKQSFAEQDAEKSEKIIAADAKRTDVHLEDSNDISDYYTDENLSTTVNNCSEFSLLDYYTSPQTIEWSGGSSSPEPDEEATIDNRFIGQPYPETSSEHSSTPEEPHSVAHYQHIASDVTDSSLQNKSAENTAYFTSTDTSSSELTSETASTESMLNNSKSDSDPDTYSPHQNEPVAENESETQDSAQSPPSSSSEQLFLIDKESPEQPHDAKELSPIGIQPIDRQLFEGFKDDLPSLSAELKEDIEKFSIEGYAAQYFAVHRKALSFFSAKKVIPLHIMMSWSKSLLSNPLTESAKRFHKDAIHAFKDIQRIMNERSGASSYGSSRVPVCEVQSLVSLAISCKELRDEIFCQVIKQITRNPVLANTRRGWSLLSALCATIPPSKNFQSYLTAFLMKSILEARAKLMETQERPIPAKSSQKKQLEEEVSHRRAIFYAARNALKGVRRLCMPGITPRLKVPSPEETEHLLNMSLYDSPFGEALDNRGNEIPRIVYYLTDAILSLGGLSTSGIFRIAGNNDQISLLRRSLERNEFKQLEPASSRKKGGKSNALIINDAHVPATLLKSWLRELEVSLIPEQYYEAALKAAGTADAEKRVLAVKKIIKILPQSHQNTLEFLVSFLRVIAGEDKPNETRMNINNIAIVFGPTILRASTTAEDGGQVDISKAFCNAKLEQGFLMVMLQHPEVVFARD